MKANNQPFFSVSLPTLMVLAGVFLIVSCNKNPVTNDEKCKETEAEGLIVPFVDAFPSWDPDGSTIAYVHSAQSAEEIRNGNYQIWLIEANGENNRFLRAGDLPDLSPDGNWLVFKNGQIFKIKTDGDSLTQLTFKGSNIFPTWSPGGQWIAYGRSICEGERTCGIWMIDKNGEQNHLIVEFGRFPTWNPITNELFYLMRVVTKNGEVLGDYLWAFDVENKKYRRLVFLTGKNFDNRHLNFSPDGSLITFTSNAQIWLMNSDGSNLTQITTEGGMHSSWSPGGSQIVYLKYSNPTLCEYKEYNLGEKGDGALWIMDSDGTNRRQLTFIPSGRYQSY